MNEYFLEDLWVLFRRRKRFCWTTFGAIIKRKRFSKYLDCIKKIGWKRKYVNMGIYIMNRFFRLEISAKRFSCKYEVFS
jgi:hypothetical protein